MRCLVTGGAGFIGSSLCERLLSEKHSVTVIDDFSSGKRDNLSAIADHIEIIEMDICDDALNTVFVDGRFDAVFHCAAQKNLRYSLDHPLNDAQINIMGSLNVLQAASDAGVSQFMFASTGGALYGELTDHPFIETDPIHALSPYAISKRSTELYLDFFSQHYGMKCCSLRYANVYGPRQDAQGEAGVIAIFIHQLQAGAVPLINGDGSQTRDFIYIDDVVDASYRAFESGASGVFNIGTGVETSISALLTKITQLGNFSHEVSHADAISGELMRSALNSTKAQTSFGFNAITTLEDGLKKMLEAI